MAAIGESGIARESDYLPNDDSISSSIPSPPLNLTLDSSLVASRFFRGCLPCHDALCTNTTIWRRRSYSQSGRCIPSELYATDHLRSTSRFVTEAFGFTHTLLSLRLPGRTLDLFPAILEFLNLVPLSNSPHSLFRIFGRTLLRLGRQWLERGSREEERSGKHDEGLVRPVGAKINAEDFKGEPGVKYLGFAWGGSSRPPTAILAMLKLSHRM